MRIALFSIAFSLAFAAAPTLAQPAPAEPIFRADAIHADITFLADDQLEGRDAGARGHNIAALFVANRFQALGLKPGGNDGGWYQQVPLAEHALDDAKPATLTIGTTKFTNGGDVLISASPRYGNDTQTLSGEAVFVGYGLESDYAGLDVKGKFVVTLIGLPKGVTQEAARAAGGSDRPVIAGRHGALGVLYLISPDNLRGAFPWLQATGYFREPQTNWLSPSGFPGGEDPGVQIGAYINPTAAKALFAGAPMSAEQVFAAALAGPVKGFALAPRLTTARTSKVRIVRSPNVIGILPGSDPALAAEYVMLSAHLDHVGVDRAREGDQIFNGAMDNAAGVATMLEAARAFTASGVRPKRSVVFVALIAEEDGLLGSSYLARYPVTGAGKLVADVNLDMPILLYDFQDVVAYGAEHSTMGEIVERAGARMGVTVSPDPMPEENFFLRSDHYSFVKAGVPSVFLMTGFKNGGEKAFRDFLATHYHKVSDQPGLPFDCAAGAKFARLNYLIAREIADAAEAPRWYEGNSFGDRFAKGAPRAVRPAK
ncbi:M20/M25/M40 family metallo-hydrolase [Sphingomonas sp. M1-B02]|uniref:M20/M25/M40 family metallo-hydrolase n=1 Tax=Sphingomonas sp. M1-B02 TaxID=3114300 RepID=UPI0022409A9F|nr:M20/M25/M40 family metallo-hydrolase [Sphingomonas sp. S6-11]UZK65746.1 M20/M25/M40 family metallo-hydrolase [Sphingomonas sp. S6-11]